MRAVLEVLVDGGASTVPAVADRLDLTRQAVQRHVNDLLALGLVETTPNPAHRRSVLVAPTTPGAASFARLRTDELRHLGDMLADCTDAEIATAAKVLAALDRDVRERSLRIRGTHGAVRER
jgi:DNA-binding MarR family transcriptional regulator